MCIVNMCICYAREEKNEFKNFDGKIVKKTSMSLSEECKKYVNGIKKLAKNPKAKKLSGYNVFSKEKREGLEGTAPEKMKELGAMWKKCSDEKKELWKAKAEKLNKKAAKEFEEDGDELDDQVKELKDLIEETIANFKKNLPKTVKEKGKKLVIEDLDSDEDSDDEAPTPKAKKVKAKKAKNVESDEESSDDDRPVIKKSKSKSK